MRKQALKATRKAKLSGFTHVTKKGGQLCFRAAWWPHEDPRTGTFEKNRPLMMFASGQCNRVSANNIKPIAT